MTEGQGQIIYYVMRNKSYSLEKRFIFDISLSSRLLQEEKICIDESGMTQFDPLLAWEDHRAVWKMQVQICTVTPTRKRHNFTVHKEYIEHFFQHVLSYNTILDFLCF